LKSFNDLVISEVVLLIWWYFSKI